MLINADSGISAGSILKNQLLHGDPFIAKNPSSLWVVSPDERMLEVICAAMQAGDEITQIIVDDTKRSLGIRAANLVGVLGSSQNFFAGDIARYGEPFLDIIRSEMDERVLPLAAESTEIDFASMRSNIVLLGTSALLLPVNLVCFRSKINLLINSYL